MQPNGRHQVHLLHQPLYHLDAPESESRPLRLTQEGPLHGAGVHGRLSDEAGDPGGSLQSGRVGTGAGFRPLGGEVWGEGQRKGGLKSCEEINEVSVAEKKIKHSP